MKLITHTQRAKLLANARAALEGRQQGRDIDPHPVIKLFTADSGCTWLLTELDPDDANRAFGLCDLGLGFPELGCVSLDELQSVRGKLGLPIECDQSFDADKTLSAYAEKARSAGHIVT